MIDQNTRHQVVESALTTSLSIFQKVPSPDGTVDVDFRPKTHSDLAIRNQQCGLRASDCGKHFGDALTSANVLAVAVAPIHLLHIVLRLLVVALGPYLAGGNPLARIDFRAYNVPQHAVVSQCNTRRFTCRVIRRTKTFVQDRLSTAGDRACFHLALLMSQGRTSVQGMTSRTHATRIRTTTPERLLTDALTQRTHKADVTYTRLAIRIASAASLRLSERASHTARIQTFHPSKGHRSSERHSNTIQSVRTAGDRAMNVHIGVGYALLALGLWSVGNTALSVALYRRIRAVLHGPRIALSNPYVARDFATGGPLSSTGVVPSGANVLPLNGPRKPKRPLLEPTDNKVGVDSDDKQPEPVV